MGTLLVVDGSDVCRAPIVAFTLTQMLSGIDLHEETVVLNRGLVVRTDDTMCESAAARLGFTGPAIAFYGAHRAAPLTVADIASASLVLTAERAQRATVVRMLPGSQAIVFTWKEALALASVLVDRRRISALTAPTDLPAVARALHGARGTVPLVEPAVRTGVFHWRRSVQTDPLSIAAGHGGQAEHRKVTQESVDVAVALGMRLVQLTEVRVPEIGLPASRLRRPRRMV